MITLTFKELEESRKSEAIAFANWLLHQKNTSRKSIEKHYDDFKKEN